MSAPQNRSRLLTIALALTVCCIGLRLTTLGLYPLQDTTEARYAEMARIMVQTGNWLTPMFDYNVPFWGKPPLFSWLSAAGFKVFGDNEFAARVPHLLLGIATVLLTVLFAKRLYFSQGRSLSYLWLCAAVLCSSSVFFLISAAVMTDSALLFSTTLSLVSFALHWHRSDRRSQRWGCLFFVGLSLGCLAKGPIALVLVGLSLGIWMLAHQRWKTLLHCLPWLRGIVIYLLLTLPWYIAAEIETPGFLAYFLVGEHYLRFVEAGWQGDLYGNAHSQPRGTIWLYWCIATLPWMPLLLIQWYRKWRSRKEETLPAENHSIDVFYLYCWILGPLILFSFAGNILWSYVLSAIPAFAVLMAVLQRDHPLADKYYLVGFITPLLFVLQLIIFASGLGKTSEKALIARWQQAKLVEYAPLVYLKHRPFSARYYSAGQAQFDKRGIADFLEAFAADEQLRHLYLVVSNQQWQLKVFAQCQKMAENRHRSLLYCAK